MSFRLRVLAMVVSSFWVVRLPERESTRERRFAGQGRRPRRPTRRAARQDEVRDFDRKERLQGRVLARSRQDRRGRRARRRQGRGEQGEGDQAKEIAARTTSRKPEPSPRPIMKWVRLPAGQVITCSRLHKASGLTWSWSARRKRHRADGNPMYSVGPARMRAGRRPALSPAEAGSADGEDEYRRSVGECSRASFRFTGTVR